MKSSLDSTRPATLPLTLLLGILNLAHSIAIVGAPPAPYRDAAPTAKNLIFLSFDELGAAYLGAYGSGVDSSPTLDRLAEKGMRFDRCYVSSPVCSPSRATWLTGRSPVVHGLIFNNLTLGTDMPTFPALLRQHGYRTGIFGKLHQIPMSWPESADQEWVGFDLAVVTEDDKWGPWLDWVQAEHPEHFDLALAMAWGPPQAEHQLPWRARWERAQETIMRPLQENSFWAAAWESPLPAEVHDATFITNESLAFMANEITTRPDEPFLAYISYVDPHDPYNPPAPYSTMFNPDDMSDPIPMRWDPAEQPMLAGTLRHLDIAELHGENTRARQARALFHGSIRFLDDQVKRIVDFLEAHDLWEDTILVITTDHGEMMVDHGLITKGSKHYDSGIRVPLIVVGGGIATGVSDRLTSSLDFYPSFCDWAAVPPERRPPLEGYSLEATCRGESDDGWSEVALWACEVGGGAYSIVTDDGWRLTRFVADQSSGQMFNLRDDPQEQNDLYRDSRYAEKRAELLERMVVALTRPSRIPQYRNMPEVGGEKRVRNFEERSGQVPTGLPVYPPLASPVHPGAEAPSQ